MHILETKAYSCPCCGTEMESRDLGTKLLHRCPSCGVTDVQLKG